MFKLMRKSKAIVFAIFVGISSTVPTIQAQDNNHKQALQQKLSVLASYRANFIQRVFDDSDSLIQEVSGTMAMQQPNQLFWQTDENDGMTIVADGTTIWQQDSFSEQVIAYNQANSAESNPFMLIAVPDGEHWQHYDVAALADGYEVRAKAEDTLLTALTLRFQGKQLIALDYLDNQNQRSQIQFSNVEQGIALPDNTFKFSLPAGFEFDDQR